MERLILVSPELADVLSAVICRIRGRNGAVPLVRARDQYELIWLPPSPLLFQRRVRTEHHTFTGSMVNALLDEALARTGLTGPSDGGPLRYTTHDFRRIFITDAVLNGLPPHIAQVIAGHHDITVTMGYKAVYPQEAIEAHRAFIARRRAIRPSEEYRTPSEEEWDAFLAHFEKRKVPVGTCARAFGTPCIHEHACVRCSLLRPSPGQRDRLEEISKSSGSVLFSLTCFDEAPAVALNDRIYTHLTESQIEEIIRDVVTQGAQPEPAPYGASGVSVRIDCMRVPGRTLRRRPPPGAIAQLEFRLRPAESLWPTRPRRRRNSHRIQMAAGSPATGP